jgi:hypothetical protein
MLFGDHWKTFVTPGNLVSSLLTKLSSQEEREWKVSYDRSFRYRKFCPEKCCKKDNLSPACCPANVATRQDDFGCGGQKCG